MFGLVKERSLITTVFLFSDSVSCGLITKELPKMTTGRKKVTETMEQKLLAWFRIDAGETLTKIVQDLGVGKQTLSDWFFFILNQFVVMTSGLTL